MANIEEFLDNYSPAVRHIARETRGVVLENFPNALEEIDTLGELISFQQDNQLVCAISPGRSHIKLVFFKSAQLPDPRGLLSSGRNGARYVRLHSVHQALGSGISDLLIAAAA